MPAIDSNQKTKFFTLSVVLVQWYRKPLTNIWPFEYWRAKRCYKHSRKMVLGRPERSGVLFTLDSYWNVFSSSSSFLTWQLYYTLQITLSLVLVASLLVPWSIHGPGLFSVLSSNATAWPIILLFWCIFFFPLWPTFISQQSPCFL